MLCEGSSMFIYISKLIFYDLYSKVFPAAGFINNIGVSISLYIQTNCIMRTHTCQLPVPAVPSVFINKKAWLLFTGLLFLLLLLTQEVWSQDVLVGLTSNGGPDGKGTAFSIKSTGAEFKLIKGFPDWGKTPYENLLLGTDGNFYGMTSTGGTFNYGSIFKVTPAGVVTVLHQFNAPKDGGNPYGSLIKGYDNNFYGMTSVGGTDGGGTIFRLTAAGQFSVIRQLAGASDGSAPSGSLYQGSDGYPYGTTQFGGTNNAGTLFHV